MLGELYVCILICVVEMSALFNVDILATCCIIVYVFTLEAFHAHVVKSGMQLTKHIYVPFIHF